MDDSKPEDFKEGGKRLHPIQKTLELLRAHPKEYELVRYIIAGGLTTILSLAVSFLFCVIVSEDHTVDGATVAQLNIGKGLSWVIGVLFAFWINRRMVFQRRGGAASLILKELAQFALSRALSGLVFEFGLLNLLVLLRVGNTMNMIIVLVFVTVFNYVVSKFWIFAKENPPIQAENEIGADAQMGKEQQRD